jgi:hypothetical protein
VALVTESGVRQRDPAGVFLLYRFDDDLGVLDPGFAGHWRGFLRLLNRLQFLPSHRILTVRGCAVGAFAGIPDAYGLFLAGGSSVEVATVVPEPTEGQPPDFDLAHPGVISLLQTVLSQNRPWPEIGFELEKDGLVAATAEAAWPDCTVAVLNHEMTADSAVFAQAGWRVFSFGDGGVSVQDQTVILSIIAQEP